MNTVLEKETPIQMNELSIVVLEQNFILREKLSSILSRNERVGSVFQVSKPSGLRQVLTISCPDIVIADICALEESGYDADYLKRDYPDVTFCIYADFVCSGNQEAVMREAAGDMGADRFVDVVEVLRTIDEIILDTSELKRAGKKKP